MFMELSPPVRRFRCRLFSVTQHVSWWVAGNTGPGGVGEITPVDTTIACCRIFLAATLGRPSGL